MPAPARPARRRRRQRRRSGQGEWRPYHTYALKCNSSGVLRFGPSADTPSLGGGVLKAYAEYRITALRVQWKAQASSTAAGSMAIQLALGSTLAAVDNRAISFKLTTSGSRTFGVKELGGDGRMLATKAGSSSGEDQFSLAYNGNGTDNAIAGDLLCFFRIETRLPK